MLTPLQERVAEIVSGLDEAEGFVLAGAAALIARGDVERRTCDLDFFGLAGDAVSRLAPAARRALSAAGLAVGHVQVTRGFARLVVADGDQRTWLELAADARLLPSEPGRPAPMLAGEELAVDKVLTVCGRAEARDFADLMTLEPRYGLERLCELAAEKDLCFDPALLAEVLGRFDRLRRDEFELDDLEFERLRGEVARWRDRAIGLGEPCLLDFREFRPCCRSLGVSVDGWAASAGARLLSALARGGRSAANRGGTNHPRGCRRCPSCRVR